jgi:hypothetical protein
MVRFITAKPLATVRFPVLGASSAITALTVHWNYSLRFEATDEQTEHSNSLPICFQRP